MSSNAHLTGRNSQSTLAFTLPISCQICLGKVKQPVVCPNHHAFCSVCMDTWLQRNQQCPACRVQITTDTPCQPVLGGLNPQADKDEFHSSKELRRCRMELVYKEYETEIDRLEAELQATKLENKELWRRVKDKDQTSSNKGTGSPARADMSLITSINNKLKDATKLYENIKTDMKLVKEENKLLKGQTENWRRENQSLRGELVGRSPRKFGRLTVATLENKVEGCEKEIKQLQRALEKSDQFIAELEGDLDKFRNGKTGCAFCDGKRKTNDKNLGRGDLEFDNSHLDDSEMPSRISGISDQLSDITPQKRANRDEESFGLEMPSPGSLGTMSTMADNDQDSFLLPKPSPFKDNPVDAAKKKLRFSFPDQSAGDFLGRSQQQMNNHETNAKFTSNPTTKPMMLSHIQPGPSGFGKEKPNLNVSMTPEIEDCLRLMDQAEQRRKDASPPQPVSVSTFQRQSSFGQDTLSAYTTGLIASGPQPLGHHPSSGPQPLGHHPSSGPQPLGHHPSSGPQPLGHHPSSGPQPFRPNPSTASSFIPSSTFTFTHGTSSVSGLGSSSLFPSAPNLVSQPVSTNRADQFITDPMVITRSVSQYNLPRSGNTPNIGHLQ